VPAAILHAGPWKDVFGDFPSRLSACTGLPITETPDGLALVYVLGWFEHRPLPCESFIPLDAIYLAHDKRKQAALFREHGIASPESHLVATEEEALAFPRQRPDKEWILKWPIGCGGAGHQILDANTVMTPLWRPPFLVQELIRMARPRVYRLFVAGGETFSWCVRESNERTAHTPFVSAAGGATVRLEAAVPEAARTEAVRAFMAAGLWDSLGGVDMIQSEAGQWLVLEMNTDGIYHFLQRVVEVPGFGEALDHFTDRAVKKRLARMAGGDLRTEAGAGGRRNG
jgi:glutathione synthase/RimK-type ligase-like ATP-grasp enzyme